MSSDKLPTTDYMQMADSNSQTPYTITYNAYDEPEGTTFESNAMRSEQKLPFWRLPMRPLVEWAKRFAKGEKYDERRGITHNWKLAIPTKDVVYVRQFYDHAFEHMLRAKDRAEHGLYKGDEEGETIMDHLGAAMWNIASLIEYLDKNPELVCKALDQTCKPIE